ncbi:MAG: hypothetical protein WEC00_00035 [Dongiaceae bacterium]
MLAGNRLYQFALGGCLAVLLLAIPALAAPGDQPDNPPTTEGNANQDQPEAAPQQEMPVEVPGSPKAVNPRLTNPPNSQESAANSSREEERAEADLEAQQEMALWAQLVFWATTGSVVVAAVAVGLVFFTLHETRKAGKAAADILEQTRRQADSAVDAAKAALEANAILIAEKRPWLHLDREIECEFLETENSVAVNCWYRLKNFGLSPAININIRARLIDAIWPPTIEAIDGFYNECWERRFKVSGKTLFPGQKDRRHHSFAGKRFIDADESREVFFMIVITYRFALGNDWGMEAQTFEFEPTLDSDKTSTRRMLGFSNLNRTR